MSNICRIARVHTTFDASRMSSSWRLHIRNTHSTNASACRLRDTQQFWHFTCAMPMQQHGYNIKLLLLWQCSHGQRKSSQMVKMWPNSYSQLGCTFDPIYSLTKRSIIFHIRLPKICGFVDWLNFESWCKSSQLCPLLSVEKLLIFADLVQSLLNMFLYDVCSLILTGPHTNQTKGSRKKSNCTSPA